MVNDTTIKTGYWRVNPATGEREWIAGNYQPPTPDLDEDEEVEEAEPVSPLISSKDIYKFDKAWTDWSGFLSVTGKFPDAPADDEMQPYFEEWKKAAEEFQAQRPTYDQLDLVQLETVTPEVTTADMKALAELYGVPSNRFVGAKQLAELALPPEKRTVRWAIPYEQYLTAEQAKFLGYDVPEGSVLLMTPMARGEPAFYLMPRPEAEKARPDDELVRHLRSAFGFMFDPANSYGYSPEELPGVIVDQLQNRLATDYQGFIEELNSLVDPQEAQDILRLFGVTEEYILQTMDFVNQEAHVNTLINEVFPDFANSEELGGLIESDFALFMETMQTGGGTFEKRQLLGFMGYEPAEINEIFSRQRMVVEVDGIRQSLTIDIENQAAYNARGDYVGAYNPATKLFTKDPPQNIFKDFWDWTAFQSRTMWEQGENFMLSVMPEIIFSEIPAKKDDRLDIEKLFSDDMVKSMNETNRRMRENFRYLYNENKEEYQDWVAKNPELVAPIAYQEGAFQHPELLKDFRYYAYELASITPFIVTATAMALVTGGVGPLAVLGTAAIMAPVEGQAVFEDLINAGAPEDKAAELAAISGAIIGLLESAGRIPLLKQVSPLLFGQFKRRAISELSKKSLADTILKFGRNFTINQFAEISTEVAQEVVSNVAVGFYDENRSVLENLPDIAVKTAVATLLPSGFAAGVSVRMVSPLEQKGMTEAAKKARGWAKDEKGNWYERLKEVVKGERGAIGVPEEKPEVKVGDILINPEGKRLTAQEWRPQAGITEKGKWLLVDEKGTTTQLSAKELAARGYELETALPTTEPGQAEQYVTKRTTGMSLEQVEKLRSDLATKKETQVTLERQYGEGFVDKAIHQLDLKIAELRGEPLVPVTPEVTKEEYIREGLKKYKQEAKELGFSLNEKLQRKFLSEEYDKKFPIPTPEAGMPEAGVQPGMFGEERVVRPRGRGEIVQISMEDQLKLDQYQQAAAAYEAEAELEGLRTFLETDPVAGKRITIGRGRKVGLEFFISLREQTFPEYFTVKQAEQLWPKHSFAKYSEKGKRTYNKVPRDEALDNLTVQFGISADEIANRVIQVREARRRVKVAKAAVSRQQPEISKSVPETRPRDVELSPSGERMLTPAQRTRTLDLFGKYVMDRKAIDAWALTEELRRETKTDQAEILKARAQELMIKDGLPAEEAIKLAIKETLSGKLPVVETEYLDDLSEQMRSVLFEQVAAKMRDYPFEMAATYTALLNALPQKDEYGRLIRHARAIPRKKGPGSLLFPEGGSAWDRLNYVFGDQPQVMKALDTISEEGTTLKDVVEGVFHEIGREHIPIDADMAEYLNKLSGIPYGYKTMMEPAFEIPVVQDLRTEGDLAFAIAELELETQLADGRITFDQFQLKRMEARDRSYPLPPVAKYEAPIDKAIKELTLWPAPATDSIVRALKELGMAPIDIGNFLRANKASFDFSFWRQQAPLIASHPISFALANVEAWKAIWSQKSAEASWSRITQDPLYQIYDVAADVGGDFLRPLILPKGTAHYRGTEEYGYTKGVGRLLPRFTAWLPHVKISARAFETGTNEHNWRIFKSYYKAMLKLNEQYASGKKKLKPGQAFDIQKEMIDFSKSLANFTARGSLGQFAGAASILSGLLFAPRMAIGRILSVKDLINANPRVRAEAWKNASLFVSTFGGIVLLGAMAGWWEVERDPRSAEYMSIRIGNTRVDPWGGFRQFLVFFTRAITGTGVSSVTGAEYKPDPLDLVQNLLRGKASPLASLLLDFWKGKNFVGEEVDIKDKKQWAERVAPFAVWDIYEAYQEDPVTALAVAVPAIVGASVQTYTGDWVENVAKLGLPKYTDSLPYGVRTPYYTTEDFWADTASQFKGVDPATLTETKGFPEYVRAITEAQAIKESMSVMPNEKLFKINADAAKGTTFAQYYQMWREREVLVATGDEEKLKEWDADERHNQAYLGNISQRQFSMLMEYHSITDEDLQAEYLEKHNADIGVNPRTNYLYTHPKENAELAVWGQEKIYTKAAYDEFKSLVNSLDIPENGMPEMTMPPEASAENYFEREAAVQEYGAMSAESMVVLARDPELLKWYQDEALKTGADALNAPAQPEQYYILKAKNRPEREYMATLTDKDGDDYIEDEKERIAKFYEEFPDSEYFDDDMRTQAISNGFDDVEVEAWVERGRLVSDYSGGSPLVKQWAFDSPDAYRKALDESLLQDRGGLATEEERGHYDEWVEPAIRLQAKNVKEDAHWNTLGDKNSPETYIDDVDKRRAAFFKQFPDSVYFDDLEKVEAYKVGFTDKEAGLWAERGRLLGTVEPQSAEAKIWLVDHQGVFDKAYDAGLLTDNGSTWNVPALRITVKWRAQDNEYNAIDGDDSEARAAYLAANTEYRKDRRRREAYQAGFEGVDTSRATELMKLAQQEHLDLLPGGKDYETMQVMPSPEALPSHIQLQTDWAKDYERVLKAINEIGKPSPIQKIIDDGIKMLDEHLASDEKTVQEHIDYAKEIGKPESDFPLIAYLQQRNEEKHLVRDILSGEGRIGTFPESQIENFVAYHELDVKGQRQERFLVDNPEFATAMHDVGGIDITKPEDVPAIEYDDIYDERKKDFIRLEGLADNESEFYIDDEDERAEERNAMRFDDKGKYTEFGLAELRRNAYGKFVPEQYVDTYVGYYTIIGEGKPEHWKLNTGTDLWYTDDWFLMENIEFYREVYRDLMGNEKKDFTKVPSRGVFNLYLTYLTKPHLAAKDEFRRDNQALDDWLVLKFDYTPVSEKDRREELTAYERFIEEWAERGGEIEERLKALRGGQGDFGQDEESADSGMTAADWKEEYAEETPHWAEDMKPSVFATEFVKKVKKNKAKDILEIGSGNGRDAIHFSKAGLNVTSIDITPKAIKLAKGNADKKKASVDFRVANAEKLPFGDNSFDSVFTLSVLHSTELKKSIPELYRVLRPGGLAFIYIYGDTQFKSGKPKEGEVDYKEYLMDLKGFGFNVLDSYKEQEDKYDEYGEKHHIFVVTLRKDKSRSI